MIVSALLFAATAAAAAPVERATYDGAGKLTALICGGSKLAVQTQFVVNFEGNVVAPMQPGSQTVLTRDGLERRWHGEIPFLNGGRASFLAAWTEDDRGTTLNGVLTAGTDLDVQSVDCVIDVPRAEFTGEHLEPGGVGLPTTKPEQVAFFHGTVDRIMFTDAAQARTLSLRWDRPCPVMVTDRWDAAGRSYRVRLTLRMGEWKQGEALKLGLTLQAIGEVAAPTANLSVNPEGPRYEFDGYGGNYCWSAQPAMTNYLLDHLQHAWTRHKLNEPHVRQLRLWLVRGGIAAGTAAVRAAERLAVLAVHHRLWFASSRAGRHR